MLFSLGGMFQHLWSLPISMSLTRPNHRTNNQVCSTLIPHTHTSHTHTHTHTQYTDTHKQHMYTMLHTYTHATHVYHTSHTHTGTIQRHTTHAFHTHTDTHTEHVYTLYTHTRTHAHMHRLVPPWGQGPCLSCFDIPVLAPGRAWHLVGIPLLPPGPSSLDLQTGLSSHPVCSMLPSM